ncbi:MAG: ClbS/DfsB family four-helix bundle protein [Candidatus Bathyarchaeota archaeon]|nr:ClbS/DfsB family four-helix bundle protein [Candidatus Bathyarchaeota archaeon]
MSESKTDYNKQDLFQKLRDEYTDILQELAQIKTQEKQNETIGNWTTFDMLKHLAGWAVWRVKATEELLKQGHTDFSHFTKTHEFNTKIVTDRAEQTWDQIVQEVRDADEKWIELLDRLSEDDIFVSTRFKSPAWDTLSQWVKIAYKHYTHHAEILQNFIKVD